MTANKFAMLVVALALLAFVPACASLPQGQPAGYAYVSVSGDADIRWDPVGRVIIGAVKGSASAGAKEFFLGGDYPVVQFNDNKVRVVDRRNKFDKEYGLDEILPAWVAVYFEDKEPGPAGSGYLIAHTRVPGLSLRILQTLP